MNVSTYNLNIHQGETWAMTLTVKDENDAAKNLTGYTGKMQIRDKPNGKVYEELATSPGSGMTITGATGEIDLALSKTETAALNFRQAHYDLYIESAGGTRTFLLKGTVTVEARITQ